MNNKELKIPLTATDCREDYIEFFDSEHPRTCINCGIIESNINNKLHWIGFQKYEFINTDRGDNETYHWFCGFKCMVHYQIKELKKEGRL